MKNNLNSNFLRKKFVEDNSLPIRVYQSPYFEYFLELYKEQFNLEEKLKDFNKALNQFNGDQELLQKEWYRIKDAIENDIKSSEAYNKIKNGIPNYSKINNLPNSNPFKETYVGYSVVSVDIKTANYSSLKYFDSKLVLDTKNYYELISKYTDLDYFKNSKIFRQLVFEPLQAKSQAMIQREMTDKITSHILKEEETIKFAHHVSSDELVLFFEKTSDLMSLEHSIKDIIQKHELSDYFKVEAFNIDVLINDCFIKTTGDGKKQLKNTPAIIYPQCFKKMNNLTIEENDLIFYEPSVKQLAKFNKSIFE